jgi:nucleotide-binding universal stress UspA family protein
MEIASPPTGDALVDTSRDAARDVQRTVHRLEALGLEADGSVGHGDPAGQLVDEANRWPAAMLVVGTHARAGVGRLALGSVAMKVVHSSPCPVLVVPPKVSATSEHGGDSPDD